MFETNIQNNSALISLARAAEITGYHQDYLGQLCRLGRLPAKKVGRNWFTSEDALRDMYSFAQQASETTPEPIADTTAPDLIQEVTISKVEGLPIALRTIPRPVVVSNTLQSLVTNLRIESLQKEVADLRAMLNRLMAEVTRHTNLLEGRVSPELANIRDSLHHSYVSNFDFSSPLAEQLQQSTQNIVSAPDLSDWTPPQLEKQEPKIMTWIVATASLGLIALMGAGIATQTFFGSPVPVVTTVYHREEKPAVAGAATEPLPTEKIAPASLNVIQ